MAKKVSRPTEFNGIPTIRCGIDRRRLYVEWDSGTGHCYRVTDDYIIRSLLDHSYLEFPAECSVDMRVKDRGGNVVPVFFVSPDAPKEDEDG